MSDILLSKTAMKLSIKEDGMWNQTDLVPNFTSYITLDKWLYLFELQFVILLNGDRIYTSQECFKN